MTTMNETKSILRRIIYVTIFCFIVYGITSVGILVDKSRIKTSVSLSTALILLAILLAFLVIFTIIICLWRRANQNIKSKQRGGDEEQLYTTSPGGHRYIRTDSELRAIKRKEKYERRQKARRRSIRDRIHHADDRTSGKQVSYPSDTKDERGNPIRGPAPLGTHSVCKPSKPFVERQEPLFGHSNGAGLFGGRPAHGAGLNPNHSRSPPVSVCSASQVLTTNGKSTHPERVYHRPEDSECKERRAQEKSTYALSEQIRKEGDDTETAYVHRERGGAAYNHAQGTEKSRVEEKSEQEQNGAIHKAEEEKMAVLSPSRPRHQISRKEVGALPRVDRDCLGVTLQDGAAPVLSRESGVTIGYGGERVIIGPGRLPSKLVGHGLMAVPTVPSQAYFNSIEKRMVGRGHAGHESWRQASGFYASRTDGILSMVSEDKSEGSKDSERYGKSWGEMTADEVQEQRKKRKERKRRQIGKGEAVYKPYVPGREVPRSRPLVVRNKTQAPSPEIRKDSPKQPTVRTEPREDISSHQNCTESVNRSPSGIHRKIEQEHDRLEEEVWLHKSPYFHADKHAQNQYRDGRKHSSTYQHLSALPDSLKLSPKQPPLKKTKLLGRDLIIATSQHEQNKRKMTSAQVVKEESTQASLSGAASTGYKTYVAQAQAITKPHVDTMEYQQSTFLEHSEEKTDWHRQKGVKEWTEQNEAEKAHQELMAALQPDPSNQAVHHSPSQTQKPSLTPAPHSFADWQIRYKFNARRRGVSGFTSTSQSSTASFFPSYEEMKQERKEKAAEEERRKFSQFLAEAGNLRGSEIERIADSALPMDLNELARIDRMVAEQLEQHKRATTMEFDTFAEEATISAERKTAVNSLPSHSGLEEAKLAQENQEWARKNYEAGSKLEVRSLHSTERGTTFSSLQTADKVSRCTPQEKSGIPRLTTTTANFKKGAIATPQGQHQPPLRQFGYNSGKKRTPDSRKRIVGTKGKRLSGEKESVEGGQEG